MTFKACSIFRLDELNDITNGLASILQKRGNNVISKERKHGSDKITRKKTLLSFPNHPLQNAFMKAR